MVNYINILYNIITIIIVEDLNAMVVSHDIQPVIYVVITISDI